MIFSRLPGSISPTEMKKLGHKECASAIVIVILGCCAGNGATTGLTVEADGGGKEVKE